MEEISFLVTVLTAMITAIFTSIIAYYIALKKFRTERLWEKKFQAYENLFEAFFNAQYYIDTTIRFYRYENTERTEVEDQAGEMSKKANIAIDKAIAIGGFLFSLETQSILRKYQIGGDFYDEDKGYDIEGEGNFVKSIISDLVKSAKQDLA